MSTTSPLVDPARLAALDWSDMTKLNQQLDELLAELATSPTWLNDAFDHVLATPELLVQSERLQELDRVVLVNDEASGVRIRLHRFRERFFDRPHNHRWSFGTRILAGSYTHFIFGDYPDLSPETDARQLSSAMVREELPGTGYVIRHTLLHSVGAVADSTSLIVRGPAEKDRFVVMNRDTGEAWWQYAHTVEDPEVIAARRLGADKVEEIRDLLKRQGVIR
jgi:hypothetical protein